MRTHLFAFFCTVVLSAATVGLHAVAQEPAETETGSEAQVTVVAQVNIHNAYYSEISHDGREYTLEFDLHNAGTVQPQVKYIIELRQKVADNTYMIVDQRAYDKDVTSVATNQTIHKKITYRVPDALSGDFQLMIIAGNERGMEYAINSFGDISVTSQIPGILINADTCFLAIEGDQDKYDLLQGTDIKTEEGIALQCDDVKNIADHDMAFYPHIVTRERTIFGKILGEESGDMEVLETGKTKSLKFPITKQERPQSYQADVTLLNMNGEAISNTVPVRYIVRGMSGTAQNITLDKDYYKKDDTAKVTAFISSNADAFAYARFKEENYGDDQKQLVAEVAITSGTTACSDTTSKTVDRDNTLFTMDVPITADCINPTVTLSVKSTDGDTLDENTFAVTTVNDKTPAQHIKNFFNTQKIYYWVLAITALAVITIIIYGTRKNKGRTLSIFFGILFTASTLLVGQADADTIRVDEGYFGGDVATCTTSLNFNRVPVGNWFTAFMNGCKASTCGNAVEVKGYINDVHILQWARNREKKYGGTNRYHYDIGGGHLVIQSQAPCTAKPVYFRLSLNAYSHRENKWKGWHHAYHTMYYTPTDCVQPPVCGNGKVEAGEICDNGGANAWTCNPAYGSSCTFCHAQTCRPITIKGPFCGDGVKNGNEQCDGKSGLPQNYTCTPQCTYGAKTTGACAAPTGTTTLKWNAPWITTFCANNTVPVPSPVKNPTYGQTVSWDCPGLNGGAATTNRACKATRLAPGPGVCNPATNTKSFATKPTTGLCCDPSITDRCVPNDTYINTITEQKNAAGKITGWTWTCKGENMTLVDKYAQCNAICKPITTVTISPNPFVIPTDNTTPIKLQAQMTSKGDCPDSECILVAPDFSQINNPTIANGGIQELTFTMEEWATAKDKHRGISLSCTGIEKISDIFTPGTNKDLPNGETLDTSSLSTGISSYCLNRSCTSDGRCQASQNMTATSARDCTQSCSTDADCTSGRMIETRP